MQTLELSPAPQDRSSLASSSGSPRPLLLWCGIAAAIVYLGADVAGGLTYRGYSFASHTVSELMAIGAPSKALVDPLFILYGLLATAFGIGVLRAAGRVRALRVAGILLLVYAVAGLPGPVLFPMHQRGTGANDLPHIVLTAILAALMLLAIGFAAFGFGARFRLFSLATLAVLVLFGALSGAAGVALSEGRPTPWLGVTERVLIYAYMLWVVTFSVMLMRAPRGMPMRRAASAP